MAKQSAGSILASLRWRKTSKAKRRAISRAMHRAKAEKRRQRLAITPPTALREGLGDA